MRDAQFVNGERAWYCWQCPTRLAWFDPSGLHLHSLLTRLDDETADGEPVYGVPKASRSRSHRPRPRTEPEPTRRLPLVAYCPSCRGKSRIAS